MYMPMLWNGRNDLGFYDFFENEFYPTMREMKTDVIEEEKDYKLEAEMPGFKKEEIHVDITDGTLSISAEHEEKNEEKDEKTGKYLRRERRISSYQRSFRVDDKVKPEDIDAKYENGVLTVVVPKVVALPEEEAKKQIEIH